MSAHNIFFAAWLRGDLDVGALSRAAVALAERHEALRMTVGREDGRVFLVVASGVEGSVEVVDASGWDDAAVLADATTFVTAAFHLTDEPLARMRVYLAGGGKHLVAITVHHLVADGSSLGIALAELVELYAAEQSGRPHGLAPMAVQFGDYAVWHRNWIDAREWVAEVEYWRPRLQGIPQLSFVSDTVAVGSDDSAISNADVRLGPELSEELRAFSRDEDVTPFMLLLTATLVAIHRQGGGTDIPVGCEVDNRVLPETRSLIGFLVNVVVLRTDVSGDPTLRELMQRVRAVCLGAYAHATTPIEKVIEEVFPGVDPSTIPLFQVHFMMQPRLAAFALGDIEIEPVDLTLPDRWYDLEVQLWQAPDDFWGQIKLDPRRFPEGAAETIARDLTAAAAVLVRSPDRRLSQLAPDDHSRR